MGSLPMKILTDMQHKNSVVVLNPLSAFPASPIDDSLALVNGVVYAYTLIGSSRSWYPLTNKAQYFIHTQNDGANEWTITHNLATKNIMFFAYDTNDNLQLPSIMYVNGNEENQIKLIFTEPFAGRAVVFAASDAYANQGTGGYTLPMASATTLGGIKIGAGLSIDIHGVVSASGGGAGGAALDGSVTITGNILPDVDNTRDLGSAAKRFANIWVNDMHVGANTLYVNDKPVIQDLSNTMTFSTSVDQSLAIKTAGVGVINFMSDSTIDTNAKGGCTLTIPANNPNKNITFSNQSNGGIIAMVASGTASQVQLSAVDKISLSAAAIDFNGKPLINVGSLTVTGDFHVVGTKFEASVQTVEIQDNLLYINKGESGAGVTAGSAGIQVDRGSASDYLFVFDETDDAFKVGLVGGLQTIATREDTPSDTAIPFWNATTHRMETSANLVWDGSAIKVNGSAISSYTLPIASTTILGGVKQGTGVSIDANGVISVTSASGSGWTYSTKDTDYTFVTNDYVFYDTTTGTKTGTLPVSPSVGTRVFAMDVAGKFVTNNLTISRNGKLIRGLAEDMLLDITYSAVEFVYSGETYGWQVIIYS